ncbi:aromatic ring-hydroxylating dioxygenase subunit alpha [Phenylobacterium sp.]|uniref:aromatic ring-hydroxylating oxygenase subunit alpha n=1 Tax=Phenylobacterium sp. TaxID=1871053 RepID=UPI002735CA97|nr:aromatic ring-hydroxylating dioxygenase subunit alpha [Phenylobacterium sp.]MDP3658490.1 aromatic ring-hydroxylating dioxygenase subunit alpha [Phenylobacterium sp.]
MKDGHNAAEYIVEDKEAGLFRIHRDAFVDQAVFERERAMIFDRSWLFAGHTSEFPNPGDFVTRSVAGRPMILVRSDDGEFRALLNTCRHRGNLVCRESKGSGAEVFRCFYHGWIYNTRGELKGIPGEEAYSEAFDRESLGLEPAPRMHNHRGCIFVSFDPDIESFEDYMGDALAVFNNTLDLGDLEFTEGQYKYSMRANWKLIVENSMDGYHGAATHERYFTHFIPAMGLSDSVKPAGAEPTPGVPLAFAHGGTQTLRNGHVTIAMPSSERTGNRSSTFLEKYHAAALAEFRNGLVHVHGEAKARMVEGGAGNYLIFPNLVVIDGWRVFRSFYPLSPDYMEISGWALMPKEDSPELRAARLEWYLGFQGPGGFATPDDVEALEGCQAAFATRKEVEWSDISRGMKATGPGGTGELQMRSFWREWNARMTTGGHAESWDD